MSYSLSPLLKPRFFVNATNKPLVGGKLYTYLAGTTTPATTYSTDTGIANTNPIILDANGECNLYLDDDVSYRLILKDANDVTYFDKDRVSSIGGGDYKVLTFNTIDDLRLKIGSEKELVAQTSGYYTVGDGGGNDFYWDSTSSAAENGGSVIKPTLLSGAGRWIQVNQLIFNVRQFGASPTATGTNNRTYINACIDAALAYNANVYVPAGVYNVLANNGLNTGINLKANTNNTLVFFGDGASSVIKRESTATLIGSDSLCWVTSNTDANYLIKDIVFDGNEQNCPINSGFTFAGDGLTTVFNYTNTTSLYPSLITGGVESIVVSNGDTTGSSPNFTFTFLTAPPVGTTIKFSNIYAYEQTSSIRMKSGTGTMNLLQLKNVQCNNNVGDGLMMSIQIKRLQIDGFYAQGRTRRPRADIQLSRIPTIETSISNVVCDALEFEPSSTNTTHTISFTNIICRATFDIGGDTNFVNVTATNVVQLGTYGIGLPFGNFFKVNGSFTNCRFARVDQIRRCNVVFNDCEFNLFNSKVSLTTADHIQIWHDVAGSYARFNRCAFNVNSPSFSTGYYCQQVVATSDTTRIVEFVDCYTKTSIEFFTKANRNGLMLIDGGKLSATTAICEVENGGTFDTNLDIRNPEQWAASGILKLGAFSATANTVIKLNGSIFYKNASPKIKIVSNTSTIAAASVPTVSVFNSLRVISDTSPIVAALRALPNTTVELAEYSIGTGYYIWRYANGKDLASNSWTPTETM